MAGHSVYRDSCLGKALKSALDEMEMKEVLPSHFTDVAMQAFDAAVLDNLKPEKLIMSTVRPVSLTGEIREGVVESYRFVDNVWTFDLASAKFKGNVFAAKTSVLHVDRIRVIAADVKVVELPSGDAGPSGEGLSSDAHLLAQFDGACCELPLPARAVAARGRGSAIPVPALRVEQRQRPAAELRMVPQADGDVDDDFLEEEEEDDGWEEAPALPARAVSAAPGPRPAAGLGSGAGGAAADEDGLVEEEDDFVEEEEEDDEPSGQPVLGGKRGAAGRGAGGGAAGARKRARGGAAPGPAEVPAEGVQEEELNSDDDMEGSGAARAFDNIVIAQYDSVKRIRNVWHLKLKAGVARLKGVDYIFTDVDAKWEY